MLFFSSGLGAELLARSSNFLPPGIEKAPRCQFLTCINFVAIVSYYWPIKKHGFKTAGRGRGGRGRCVAEGEGRPITPSCGDVDWKYTQASLVLYISDTQNLYETRYTQTLPTQKEWDFAKIMGKRVVWSLKMACEMSGMLWEYYPAGKEASKKEPGECKSHVQKKKKKRKRQERRDQSYRSACFLNLLVIPSVKLGQGSFAGLTKKNFPRGKDGGFRAQEEINHR